MAYFPAGWALQKPKQDIDPDVFTRMWRAGSLIALKKYNGHRGHIVTAGANTRIYSRNGTVDLTSKLPHLVEQYAKAPMDLVIDGEIFVQSTETTEALQLAMNSNALETSFAAFDMLDLQGKLHKTPYEARLRALGEIMAKTGKSDPAFLAETLPLAAGAGYDEALSLVEKLNIEGIVAWDRRGIHKLNTAGNTKRGDAWKIKIRKTEDLIATQVHACADSSLGCGSLSVARRLSDGALQPLGKVGSFEVGFDRHAALLMKAPFAVEVSHYGEDDNGNLMFAKVIGTRLDLHRDLQIAA